MFRIKVDYTEQEQPKVVYSLWYVTEKEAATQGLLNIKGLYAETCVKQGKATVTVESKKKH
jgi:hypothetical protein